jgi:hypothetical protein
MIKIAIVIENGQSLKLCQMCQIDALHCLLHQLHQIKHEQGLQPEGRWLETEAR